ncbi:MAG: heavy metal sensor histidine kinase [Planctomycetes bacterium]|nr:heavy metal sensor histidine kinase [Planctomycetota bacterium]
MSSTTRADRGSLAGRLTLWYSLSAFLLVLGATGYLYWALARNLDREDDGTILDQIHILRILLRDHPGEMAAIRQEVEVESTARQYTRMFIRILDPEGRVVAETSGMAERLPAGAFPEPREGAAGRAVQTGKESFRVMSATAALGGRPLARTIQVAFDRSEEDKLLSEFRSRLLPLLGVSLVLCGFVGYQIARRGLRPVERISETARTIRSTTLGERLPAGEFPAELGTLARTFNEMLDRLQESFDRISRFSADIAHELRTPLSNLRGEVEVALGRARSPEEYRETLSSFLEEAARLSRLIESLLFLARAEHPETQIQRETLDVAQVLGGVREFYEAAAGESGVTLGLTASGSVPADLDRTLLQRAVGNLVENALAHTGRGGTITLGASRENGTIKIEVSDTGCGIAAEHLPRVFDRLYRADRSRTAATGGSGLGLAIVKSIAELHGGRAQIASEAGKGTRVSLVLPAQMTKT